MEKKPVLLHKKESERAALNRRSSYAFKKASEDSEEWKVLEINDPKSKEHNQIIKEIKRSPPDESILNLNATGNYVQSLNYLPMNLASSVSTAAAIKTTHVDETDNNSLAGDGGDVLDQSCSTTALCVKLVGLLRKGLPVPFGIIKSNFEDTDDATLFTVLSSCSLLVRGNFVLQSRLLPLPPNVQLARNFLLYLFQALGVVSRPRLVYAFDKYDSTVTATIIHGLLQQLGHKIAFGWKCKVGDNVEFCQGFPEQAHLYQQYWERQSARFERLWNLYHEA
jgi:DNA-directed RNA polymerase-3 subunit RPC5